MCAMLFHDNWQALHEQHTHRPTQTQTEQCCNLLLSIKLSNSGFSLLHAGWRNVVFRWGFNSLFTAALLGQNSFLEANVNQSNLMSAQQGLSSPTVWVSRIFVPPLREKKKRQLRLCHLHHSMGPSKTSYHQSSAFRPVTQQSPNLLLLFA